MGVKNIIIFGETGCGKSSVVNLLLGQDLARVSDSAIGCTVNFEKYSHADLAYYDTIGLSEGKEGAIDDKTARKRLGKLVDSLSGDGVSLAIFVIRKSRITTMTLRNYELFTTKICLKKVPVLIMVTGCEDLPDMGQWWRENHQYFSEYKEFQYVDVVCGCAKDNKKDKTPHQLYDFYEQRRQETKQDLEIKIRRRLLTTPWKTKAQLWKEAILASAAGFIIGALAPQVAVAGVIALSVDYINKKSLLKLNKP